MYFAAEPQAGVEIIEQRVTKPRRLGPTIQGAKRLAGRQTCIVGQKLDADVECHRAHMQLALRLRGAVALAQIIEPGRAMIALGPQFGVGDVARDRPAIGAVALARELHFLHQAVEHPGAVGMHAVFDLHHQRPAAAGERQPHFRIGQKIRGLVAPADRRHRQPKSKQRRTEHRRGRNQQRHFHADKVGQMAPAPAADGDAAGNRGLERGQRAARDPAWRGQLHADIEQCHRQHPHRSRQHQRRRGQHRLVADRDHGNRKTHGDRADAYRGFTAQSLAHLGDVERADHRAHAEGAEHDAIGLRAAMQQVARHQRHQRRYRAAGDAGHQRARQHDADRG